MTQIKLTPEELRQSAQRYAQGSQEIDQILNTLTHEQQVIDANWDGSAFDSFEAQFKRIVSKNQTIRSIVGRYQRSIDQSC